MVTDAGDLDGTKLMRRQKCRHIEYNITIVVNRRTHGSRSIILIAIVLALLT